VSEHLRLGLLFVFARGLYCLWCQKSRWSSPLGAFVPLKNQQKWIKGEKATNPQVGWVVFIKNSQSNNS